MTASAETTSIAAPVRRRSRVRRAIAVVLGAMLLVVVTVPLVAAARVVVTARQDDRTPTDVIVVLGASQFWGRPSPVLEARLSHGLGLYHDAVAPRLVTVGGNQPGDRTTEAQAGKEWLVTTGADPADVTAVPQGRDTLGSLTAVARLMAARGWTSATIVTDPAHLARSLDIARSLGIDAHGSATTSGSGSSLTADYVVRESAGLLYFWGVERRRVDALVGR